MEPESPAERRAHEVIGAAIEVHRALGPGFLESAYEAALSHELRLRDIPHVTQCIVDVGYKGQVVGVERIDMLVDRCLVVELKAVEQVAPIHIAQVVSYLRATNLTLGLLINFNVTQLTKGIKRVIR